MGKRSVKKGLPPGTLVYVGKHKEGPVKIDVLDYDEKNIVEKSIKDVADCIPFRESASVTWINVIGVHDVQAIESLGTIFSLHPLVMEDIVNTTQRAKLEEGDDYLYLVLRMLSRDKGIKSEQVSLVIGKNYVISFQEESGDVFDAVRERLRAAKGKIRKNGTDYLAYALIDAIVDSYFSILEHTGEDVEELEDRLITRPGPELLNDIHKLKRDLLILRKSVWPLREVISNLVREETKLIKTSTQIYLRDLYDHTIQVIDTIETLRDMTSSMLDVYLSSVSNKMNEVMKVLTIFATIFIPLTFIAGIYGMNFEHMPELSWKYGYAMVWGFCILVGVTMLTIFRRRGWI